MKLYTYWHGDMHDATTPPSEATEAEALAFALPLVRKALEGELARMRVCDVIGSARAYGSLTMQSQEAIDAVMRVLEAAAKGEKG